jgi:large subunit ribosomal protein L17e
LKWLPGIFRKKQCVPFVKYTGGIGRHAQAKQRKVPGSKGAWPQKATKVILDLLTNAQANAEMKSLDADELSIVHAQANQAQKTRRRTYRAHGRNGPYMARPAHVEIVVAKNSDVVKKGPEEAPKAKLTARRAAQLRIKAGGGVE